MALPAEPGEKRALGGAVAKPLPGKKQRRPEWDCAEHVRK